MSERHHLFLSRLSSHETDDIWATVSCFIERHMIMRKGVSIIGLGTFTFSLHKLQPIFILSEKLCQTYGFKQKKLQNSDVPVLSLNFSSLSVESLYERDRVEECVRHTVLLLLRSASTHQFAAHAFPRIGLLTFKQTRVEMIFYRDFISRIDAAGKLSAALTSGAKSQSSKRWINIKRPVSAVTVLQPRASAGESQRNPVKLELLSVPRQPHEEDRQEASHQLTVREIELDASNVNRRVLLSQPANDTTNTMTVKRSSDPGVNMTCHDHRRAGQELCYLCMQRAQKNISFSVSDERRRAEQEQEKVLMLNQHQKDVEYFQKEEMDRLKKREASREVAAFNLTVVEAQRHRKTVSQSQGSYIFAGRLCTPNHLLRQRCYVQELMCETARHKEQRTQTHQEQQQLDKQHVLQQCEEIAFKQSQELHDKHKKIRMYQKALKTQSEDKRSEITHDHGDLRPVFGMMDGDPAAVAQQTHGAQKISEELKTINLNERRKDHVKRSIEQKKEREIIQKEMLEERIRHCENVRHLQDACEKNWQHSISLRCQREQEELDFRRFGGQTLTEQLKTYQRCRRCERVTTNRGQSNIFRDANYLSGSRLML